MESLSTIFAVAAGVGLIGLAAFGKSMVYTLEQNTEALITRFGRYIKTEKEPGLHFKLPPPFAVIEKRIPTAAHPAVRQLEIKTNNDLFVNVPVTVQWYVSDAKKYYFDKASDITAA